MGVIKQEEIKKLAELARIELEGQELESFRKDIASILDFVSQVQEVSEKTLSDQKPIGVWSLIKNNFREDEKPHERGQFTEAILNAAPRREGNYIKVKKIL